jgi:hypothetical protein
VDNIEYNVWVLPISNQVYCNKYSGSNLNCPVLSSERGKEKARFVVKLNVNNKDKDRKFVGSVEDLMSTPLEVIINKVLNGRNNDK